MAWNPLNALLGLFSRDIGIDLGTANTLVLVRGKGIAINEPTVVAMNPKTKRVLAVGAEAKQMVGRTPANIVAVRPLKDGVISDFDVTEQMLRYFIEKVHEQYAIIPRPRVVIGISSGVTEVERRAVHDATINAGAREVFLIEEPMAAAIGAGHPGQRRGRLDDRRHRRRHHRGRGDLAGRDRRQPLDPDRRRRDGPGHHHPHAPAVQPADRRAHGRGGEDRRRRSASRSACGAAT